MANSNIKITSVSEADMVARIAANKARKAELGIETKYIVSEREILAAKVKSLLDSDNATVLHGIFSRPAEMQEAMQDVEESGARLKASIDSQKTVKKMMIGAASIYAYGVMAGGFAVYSFLKNSNRLK